MFTSSRRRLGEARTRWNGPWKMHHHRWAFLKISRRKGANQHPGNANPAPAKSGTGGKYLGSYRAVGKSSHTLGTPLPRPGATVLLGLQWIPAEEKQVFAPFVPCYRIVLCVRVVMPQEQQVILLAFSLFLFSRNCSCATGVR